MAMATEEDTEAIKIQEAMDLLYLAVKGRRLSPQMNSRLMEWRKSFRDILLEAVREDKEASRAAKRANAAAGKGKGKKQSWGQSGEAQDIRRQRLEAKAVLKEMSEQRKKDRAERKLEKATASLWRLSQAGVPSLVSLDAASGTAEAFAESLDATVLSRDVPELQHEDCFAVEQLGQLIAAGSIFGDGLKGTDVVVDEVPGVMTRYHFFSGEAVTIRLHLFNSLAETYIHNHKTNFVSMCLYGQYVHSTWITEGNDGKHYEFVRSGDGALSDPVECMGELVVASSFTHETSKTYFLAKEACHTVYEQSEGCMLRGTLTLYVKGNTAGLPSTKVLSPSPSCEWAEEPQLDVVLEGEQKAQAIERITAMLRLAAADQLRTPV